MTKTKGGQHVNSIITTMASKCLSARQIKILEETLHRKIWRFGKDMDELRLSMLDRMRYCGPEFAEIVKGLSKKEALEVLTKIVYSTSDGARGQTPPTCVKKALLPESAFNQLKSDMECREDQIKGIIQDALGEGDEVYNAIILAINFMIWSEDAPDVVCNSFARDLAKIKKEAIEKMEAIMAEPLIINKPVPPNKPKATKKFKKSKKTKGF